MGRSSTRPPLPNPVIGRDNLRHVFDQTRDWERLIALDYWTTLRHRLICNPSTPVAKSSIRTLAGMFAALSPNNAESLNYLDVFALCVAQDPTTVTVHTYNTNRAKAIRILNGEDPLDVIPITAMKTRSMYICISEYDNPTEAVIDGHMVSAYLGTRLTMDKAGISAKEYVIIAEAVRDCALDQGWLPSQYQAAVWLCWKRIHKILYNPQLRLEFE